MKVNDNIHREDGPAALYLDGHQEWHRNGKHHREDGPSVIYPDGRQYWYEDGKIHREDGPAIILGKYIAKIIRERPYAEIANLKA